ncbi:filamentous hemagglutinin N-terminal domain-containing protein [Solimonas terrae]|uniref:Filamentous hemagglutinin N-terminal domain-containing protein n=1 Tax=Solimonas terrae TaxID=1396819 RepID=A0A6M2BPS3_9GAMM|nr:filamentous hemagglutinin N-terminal domain-containing protein [Solimonas terrae]NGY04612.1 filamentous hemagglutinin N-terminal domain-containing protein [Solimonas terrae]
MKPYRLKLHPITAALRFGARGAVGSLLPGLALANPSGGVVVAGQAGINSEGTQTTITQSSQSAVVNWQSFSVGSNEYVVFHQPNASAAILNRVVGGSPSDILGSISANGRVFIINPHGVMFGQNSRIDVGSLVATTMDISNADFQAGRYQFVDGSGDGKVDNAGVITASNGGFVVLAADQVGNSGLIQAQLGDIALASGSALTLNLDSEGLVNFSIDGAALSDAAGVRNLGTLAANGGRVYMSADVARQLIGTVVNNQGRVSAQSIEEHDGQIVLSASGGDIAQSGTVDASGDGSGDGGSVQITGTGDIALAAGSLTQAGSASAHGGSVAVAGDGDVDFDAGARLDVAGAQGGSVELSGHRNLRIRGDLELGNGGSLLIDPTTVTIAQGQGSTDNGSDATVFEQTLEGLLAQGASVYIAADQAIHVADLSANGGDGILDGRAGGYGGSLTLGIGTQGYGGAFGTGTGFSRGDGVSGGGIFFDNTANTIAVDGDLAILGGYTAGELTLGNLIGNSIDLEAADAIHALGSITANNNGQIYIDSTGGDVTTHALNGGDITVSAETGALAALGDITISSGTGTVDLRAGHDLTVGAITIDAGSAPQSYGGSIDYGSIRLSADDGDLSVDGATLVGDLEASLSVAYGGTPGLLSITDSTIEGYTALYAGNGAGITLGGVTINDNGLYASVSDGGALSADNLTASDIYLTSNSSIDTSQGASQAAMQLGNLTATDGGLYIDAGGDITTLHNGTALIQGSENVEIYAGESYDSETGTTVGGNITLDSVHAGYGIDISNDSASYYGGAFTVGSHDITFAHLTADAGSIYVTAERNVLATDPASSTILATDVAYLSGENLTIGDVSADSVDLNAYGGTINTGAITAFAGNSYSYGDDIFFGLHDLGEAHGAIGTTGPIRVTGGAGSVAIFADSGYAVSGLNIDAGIDPVDGTRGSIEFFSSLGSLSVTDSTLHGDVTALLLGYSDQSYGGNQLGTLAVGVPTVGDDKLYIDGVAIDGDLVAYTDGGQAIDIGTLTATGEAVIGEYSSVPASSITALDITAGGIELGRDFAYGGTVGTDILVGSLHATDGDVEILAGRNIGIISGSTGTVTADQGGVYLSAGTAQIDTGNGYAAGGGDIEIGDLQARQVAIDLYGGQLDTGAITVGGGSDYYDVYFGFHKDSDSIAHIGTIESISVTDHAGHVYIGSDGDLDIASIGRIDSGSGTDGYGGTTLGSVSIGSEGGDLRVNALDVIGDLSIHMTNVIAHDGNGIALTASGSTSIFANMAAQDVHIDAGRDISVDDIDAGSDGSVALLAHDGDLYRNGTISTADLSLQANSLSLDPIVLSGSLSLTSNTGGIELGGAQASSIDLHAANGIDSGDLNAGSSGSIVLVADSGAITTGALTTGNLSVTATSLDFGDVDIAGDLSLTASGGDLSVGNLTAGSVSLSATDALSVGGQIGSSGATSLNGASIALADQITGSSITIDGGALSGILDLVAGAGGIALDNSSGTVDSASLSSTGAVGIVGPLTATGAIAIDGGSIALADQLSASSITIDGGALSGKLDLQAGPGGIALHNSGSNVTSAKLDSGSKISIAASLTASGNVTLNAAGSADFANITAHNITIDAGSDSTLTHGSVLTAASGKVHLGGPSFSGSSLTVASASLDLASDLYVDALDIDVSGANGLSLDNVLLSGTSIDLGATHGITLDDLTIDASQIGLTAGDTLTATDTVLAGNLTATAGGTAQIDNATWQGGTASLEAASLDIGNSQLAYTQSASFITSDGSLNLIDSSFGPISTVQPLAATQSPTVGSGNLSLQSAGDIVLGGSDIRSGRLTLTAAGGILDDGSAANIDVDALRANAGTAIDFARSSLIIGTGSSGVAGDSGLLQLLAAQAPQLLPTATAPNGSLHAQSIALGTLAMSGDYLSLTTNALTIGHVSAAPAHLLVQIQPLAATTGIELSQPTTVAARALSSPAALNFSDAAAFAPYDASLAFGGSNYAGDINVDSGVDVANASTNFLFMTSGHVNGHRNLATNGQVIVLSGIVTTENLSDFELPLIGEIQSGGLGDTPPLDDNPAAHPDDTSSLITIEDAPGDTQCR